MDEDGYEGFEFLHNGSRNGGGGIAAGGYGSQTGETITDRGGDAVQSSQPLAVETRYFTAHLLPNSVAIMRAERVAPPTPMAPALGGRPGTVPSVATTPTVADLTVLFGGRERLLRVAEVAKQLGVCAATVYRLCERGELLHLRVVNSIRIRPRDLADFVRR